MTVAAAAAGAVMDDGAWMHTQGSGAAVPLLRARLNAAAAVGDEDDEEEEEEDEGDK